MNAPLYTATPTVAVVDSRGLAVRSVAYHRRLESESIEARVSRQAYDTLGHLVAQWDPRLWGLAQAGTAIQPNLTSTFSLSGQTLASTSVDAGWRVSFLAASGLASHRWDSRGSETRPEYDALLRPVAVFEQAKGSTECCVERLTYAGSEAASHNLCGQLIRHDDAAGTLLIHEIALNGGLLQQSRRFLAQETLPDWPAMENQRDELLEFGAAAMTRQQYSALGEALQQTDVKGHRQRFDYNVAGQVDSVWLQLAGQAEQRLLSAVGYNAFGQVETQSAGNGVVTTARYSPVDGRLEQLLARKADSMPLQDLSYRYDPMGNVLSIRDNAQLVRHFNNQRIEPVSSYRYDTLYQLIEATGRESAAPAKGPGRPRLQPAPFDPNQLANYTQSYTYDASGNLTALRHVGAQSYTREMLVASHSNHSVIKDELDLVTAFDANGNLQQLQPGQALTWDLRNQLRQVTPVERPEAANDDEVYVYDSGGQRVRKIRSTQAKNLMHRAEVRYLPGLEWRTNTATGEALQVISVNAGRNGVRVLHWEQGQPDDLTNDQVRYSLSDHLGSSSLELDQQAQLISQEGYYPYGGTAWWVAKSAIEANYKTIRYSGKEGDSTGLYYYGFRYYAPWLQRWINPDPAGDVDGLNLFRMVRNNPTTLVDRDGLQPIFPVLESFLSDVFHDPGYKRIGSYLLNSDESIDYAPIAIWQDRIYVGTASRHMGIRPDNEIGFPDFVGEIQGKSITNDSGHYKPPPGLGHHVPEGYIYTEKHMSTTESYIRLTMISSPQEFITKVSEFRARGDDVEKAKGILEFLTEHSLYEQAKASACNYENVHITNLFRLGGVEIEPGFEEVYADSESQVTALLQSISLLGTSKDKKIRLEALNKKIATMDKIRASDPTVSSKPYSTISETINPLTPRRQAVASPASRVSPAATSSRSRNPFARLFKGMRGK